MRWILDFYRSSLGKKWAMALTGVVLFGFVLGHMLGNLKVYQGAEAFNHYAEGLRAFGAPFLGHGQALWIARIGLLAAVILHMHAAWATTRKSRAARAHRYAGRRSVQMTYAERTMRWGGVIIALFVVYHLAHLTWGFDWAHPDFREGEPYYNFVVGFESWPISLFYIVAQVFLALHLYHGLWSMFQSVGWVPRGRDWRRPFASVFAWIILIGNVSFPLAVLAGLVHL